MTATTAAAPSFRDSVSLAAALGALGGTALVLFAAFFSPGKLMLLPYALFVVATGIVLKSCRVPTYSARFGVGFAAFVLASLVLYVFIAVAAANLAQISVAGHALRLLAIAAIGAAIHAAVARVSA